MSLASPLILQWIYSDVVTPSTIYCIKNISVDESSSSNDLTHYIMNKKILCSIFHVNGNHNRLLKMGLNYFNTLCSNISSLEYLVNSSCKSFSTSNTSILHWTYCKMFPVWHNFILMLKCHSLLNSFELGLKILPWSCWCKGIIIHYQH
jgi:hypothetical protein